MHQGLLSAEILELLPKERPFDNAIAHLMSDAYYEACRLLHDSGQPIIVRQLLARRVIELVVAGETRSFEIANRALCTLGIEPRDN